MEFIFEIFIEGIFAGIRYLFNKFFKNKVSDKAGKVISSILSIILIIGVAIIIISIVNKINE